MDEFGLIRRFFTRPVRHAALGVGDDAALLEPVHGCQTVVSTDMLVEGVHFLASAEPHGLGHKALAVNLSDLAAMGALPRHALLGIALPALDEAWLSEFAGGFAGLAAHHAVDWVGGDTTRGPRNLCVTVLGEVPRGAALLRSGARPGDALWVSGAPGLAALGLAHLLDGVALGERSRDAALARLHRPEPRVALGLALRGVATACIDVSDGLAADLGHLLRASGAALAGRHEALPLGAELDWPALAAPLRAVLASDGSGVGETRLREALLAGGDDYELLFSAPAGSTLAVRAAAAAAATPVTCIGQVCGPARTHASAPAVVLIDGGQRETLAPRGYLHFG